MLAAKLLFADDERALEERLGLAVALQVVIGFAEIGEAGGNRRVGGSARRLGDGERALVGLRGLAVGAPSQMQGGLGIELRGRGRCLRAQLILIHRRTA